MHVLVVAGGFPTPNNPTRCPFIKEQVLQLSQHVPRITVLCPVPRVPAFLKQSGRRFFTAALPRGYSLKDNQCEVIFPRYVKLPGNLLLSWTRSRWCFLVEQTISRFASSCPVSLIHAHKGDITAFAAIRAARRHGLPCVVTYHGSEVHEILAHRLKGWTFCRDAFRLADLNLPVSRALERILRANFQPQGMCQTLYLGVDQTLFYPPETPNVRRKRVVFVGRIHIDKGIFDLLTAWRAVASKVPDARLSVIGQDYTHGLLSKRVHSLGLAESVEILGPLTNCQVAEILRESLVFCLPSYAEGTPVSAMEALAVGLPVVATRVGGIPEIVEHGRTGLLLDAGDTTALADGLLLLLRDRELCLQMGTAARRYAQEHLDARSTALRIVDYYQMLLSRTKHANACHSLFQENLANP